MSRDLITLVCEAIAGACEGGRGFQIIHRAGLGRARANQWGFYLKPEVTRRRAASLLRATLSLTVEKMHAFGLDVQEIHVLSADYLNRHCLMPQHYASLYSVARDGKSQITVRAREHFRETYSDPFETATVLGGFEVLDRYPVLSASSLYSLWCDSASVSLARGASCSRLDIEGERIYVLNGFVPWLLQTYTVEGHALTVFTLSGDIPWQTMRARFLGGPDPATAAPGSLRNELFLKSRSLGIRDLSLGANGVHCSAGPVEAVIELVRLTSDLDLHHLRPITDFQFGHRLTVRLSPMTVEWVLRNPLVHRDSETLHLYDWTQGLDEVDALELIQALWLQHRSPTSG
jgi:hypothetical protein